MARLIVCLLGIAVGLESLALGQVVEPPLPPANDNVLTGFVLWNADTNTVIGPLGSTVDRMALCGGCNVNIEAVPTDPTPSGATDRVNFSIPGASPSPRSEGALPYMAAGDRVGNINPLTLPGGHTTVTAIPTAPDGTVGTVLSQTITVVN